MNEGNEVNKTVIVVTVSVIIGITILGSILLLAIRPDASATLISQVTVLLGLLVPTIGGIIALTSLGKKVEEVRSQTNGTLSRKDSELQELRAVNAKLLEEKAKAEGVLSVVVPTVMLDTTTDDSL